MESGLHALVEFRALPIPHLSQAQTQFCLISSEPSKLKISFCYEQQQNHVYSKRMLTEI